MQDATAITLPKVKQRKKLLEILSSIDIKEHGETQEDMTQMQTNLRTAIRTSSTAGYFLFLSYYD